MKVEIEWAGQVDYNVAWDWQKSLVAEWAESSDLADKFLLLEHPHTYTLGRRGKIENLLWDEATLAEKGVSVHRVDRSGDITYHGPGQLVGYPILNLAHLSYFSGIVPCGIADHGVTSMEKVTGRPFHTTDIIPHVITAFEQVFQVETKIEQEIEIKEELPYISTL